METTAKAPTTTKTKKQNINNKNKQLINNHRSVDGRGGCVIIATTVTSSSQTSVAPAAATNHRKQHSNNSTNFQKTYQAINVREQSGVECEVTGSEDENNGSNVTLNTVTEQHCNTHKLTAKQSKATAKAAAGAAVECAIMSFSGGGDSSDKSDILAINVDRNTLSSQSSRSFLTLKSASTTTATTTTTTITTSPHKSEKLEQKTETTATTGTELKIIPVAIEKEAAVVGVTFVTHKSCSNSSNKNKEGQKEDRNFPTAKNKVLGLNDNRYNKNNSNKGNINEPVETIASGSIETADASVDTIAKAAPNSTTTKIPTVEPTNETQTAPPNAIASVTTTVPTWNHSKYLHKKFKRLASTTNLIDTSVNADETIKIRTISMPSASAAPSLPLLPTPQIPVTGSIDDLDKNTRISQQTEKLSSSTLANIIAFANANEILLNENKSPNAQRRQHPLSQQHFAAASIIGKKSAKSDDSKAIITVTSLLNNDIIDKNVILDYNDPNNSSSNNNNRLILFHYDENNKNKLNNSEADNNFTATMSAATASPVLININSLQTKHQHQQKQEQQPLQHQYHQQCLVAAKNTIHIRSTHQPQQHHNHQQHQQQQQSVTISVATATKTTDQCVNIPGRHVCPFCNLNCTKPSVLQKHIRAHTNERPYPCDICGFAFKTKSNYYKHCRSRTHVARKRGIELPSDIDDSSLIGSDQEPDTELSNSSSDVMSRTTSPLDESTISSPLVSHQHQLQQQHSSIHNLMHSQQLSSDHIASPSPSPSSLLSIKSTYLHHQPTQKEPQQLPLGSPAAGTLPPLSATSTGDSNSENYVDSNAADSHEILGNAQRQCIDYKPYKPKFHKAALYVETKNVPIAVAVEISEAATSAPHQPSHSQKSYDLQMMSETPITAQDTELHQHPLLSVSTKANLNSHINSDQLHMQMQLLQQNQQQKQLLQNAASNSNAMQLVGSLPAAHGVCYLAQATSLPPRLQATSVSAASLLNSPTAHMPTAPTYYNPVAAAAHQQTMVAFHVMTPQQQQPFDYQMQLQHHIKQQPQQQLQIQQPPQQESPILVKTHQALQRDYANVSVPSGSIRPQSQYSPLQFLANTANTSLNHSNTVGNSTNNGNTVVSGSSSNSILTSTASNPLSVHRNISAVTAVASNGSVQLNKEFLTEHISKLISQNEAIVENKELLLQKKYPKTLNRSRSFNIANNSNIINSSLNNISVSNSSGANIQNNNNSQSASTINTSLEIANAKLAESSANSEQPLQHQHQMQQQLLQQQIGHHRQDDQYQQHQTGPINGISKGISPTINACPQQSYWPKQKQQQPQQQYYHAPISLQEQAQHLLKENLVLSSKQIVSISGSGSGANVPLNLSSKSANSFAENRTKFLSATTVSHHNPGSSSYAPRKRHSIEQHPHISVIENITTYSSSSSTKHSPPNNSIIKNLLLNARGLAVPTGEGEDAVYVCPLCTLQFRTAEDLQLHNSTYCQDASGSAPISPAPSPSRKYLRSSSISLNLPDLKNSLYLSQNPLSLASLAKVAWSQLKTKPSSLVLNQLSAIHSKVTANSTIPTTTTITTNKTIPAAATNIIAHGNLVTLSVTSGVDSLHVTNAPLPSPGPLLGKTPLVDAYNNYDRRNEPEDVVITNLHYGRHFSACSNSTQLGPPVAKRSKYDFTEHLQLQPIPSKEQSPSIHNISISGGEMQLLSVSSASFSLAENYKDDRIKRFNSSGGCMIPISECNDIDMSPKMIRTPLLSGGSFQEVSIKTKGKDSKMLSLHNISKLSSANISISSAQPQHFQFPPINPITGYNPLTLPPISLMSLSLIPVGSECRVIPYVPGIPGPHSLDPQLPPALQQNPLSSSQPALSPRKKNTASPLCISPEFVSKSHERSNSLPIRGTRNSPNEVNQVSFLSEFRSSRNWSNPNPTSKSYQPTPLSTAEAPKKSFNFQRIVDNLSPRKNVTRVASMKSASEVSYFNLENPSKRPEITPSRENLTLAPLHIDTAPANVQSSSSISTNSSIEVSSEEISVSKRSRFLRPTSLPLRPGTFTPKRHHGITPNANTLPLISPETPRPSKACVQLYLNGHAYTYLGLKCSTKVFYCTVNLPQPSYVADNHKLSMYSVWQVRAENNPYPLGLKPKLVLSLYDSRMKLTGSYTMAGMNMLTYALVVSQHPVMTPFLDNQGHFRHHQLKQIAASDPSISETIAKTDSNYFNDKKDDRRSSEMVTMISAVELPLNCNSLQQQQQQQSFIGGYESHEDYTYIRGRGRGRYVCSECGIRCKKPSMLKKHIRTHTDVRPYTCKHCNFSFKTKGNLTKHMQSKSHYRKCIELGINPGPMPADGDFLDPDVEFDQQSSTSASGRTSSLPGDSDSDDFSEGESESSDTDDTKSRLQEHEAARCLLSLSMTPPIIQTTATSPQPLPISIDVYTYQQTNETSSINIVDNYASYTSTSSNLTTNLPATASTSSSVRRIVTSFTSPKPPFDYQKQEQYYSNPEESKPKRNINTSLGSCYDSTPIDLTKPRSSEAVSSSSKLPLQWAPSHSDKSITGNQLKTPAQIRDIIFGATNNESGFLKTLISVSDKIRNSTVSERVAADPRKVDDNVLLQTYLTEQALQYSKIKQCQMNRGSQATFTNIQNLGSTGRGGCGGSGNGCSTIITTSMWERGNTFASVNITDGCAINSLIISTSSTNYLSTPTPASKITNNKLSTSLATTGKESWFYGASSEVETHETITESNEVFRRSLPESRNHSLMIGIPTETNMLSVSQSDSNKINTLYKSSDEGEESECPSDQELQTSSTVSEIKVGGNLTNASGSPKESLSSSAPSPHNANLPSAVQHPDTTDFSGVLSAPARTVIVGEDGFKKSATNEILPVYPRASITTDGRPICTICSKSFQKQHQLVLHMNIHYMERKFKCESCGVSFRTQGHLQKHERSEAHKNKVMMTSTFGVPTTSNPRPFECTDCKIAFRIHGHLAKHLRSKTHVQKLECLQKLPFGTYAEIERAGISLTEIDTSDCENSLISLQLLAQKLIDKDPSKLCTYTTPPGLQALNDTNSNAGPASQDSVSEDGFSAAASAAATAIASLDNDSATNTPHRGNSSSEEDSRIINEGIQNALQNNSGKRYPTAIGNLNNGEGDYSIVEPEKRPRLDLICGGDGSKSAGAVAVATSPTPQLSTATTKTTITPVYN